MQEDPKGGARVKLFAEAQRMLNNRQGMNYSLYIKARDAAKYALAAACPGCKYANGQVQTQCGHSPALDEGGHGR